MEAVEVGRVSGRGPGGGQVSGSGGNSRGDRGGGCETLWGRMRRAGRGDIDSGDKKTRKPIPSQPTDKALIGKTDGGILLSERSIFNLFFLRNMRSGWMNAKTLLSVTQNSKIERSTKCITEVY